MMLLISALYIFAACCLGALIYLMVLLLSYLTDNMKTEERTCDNCYYRREGKCTTKFPEECKRNEHFLGMPTPPAVEPAHTIPKKKIEIAREGEG